MDIQLRNTATGRKDRFDPIDPANVRVYVCGPTVYDRAHLGNARPVVVFDILFRLLRHVYGTEAVTYVRNFTDIEDKIMDRARETGREISAITQETAQWYLDDMAAVGALEPTHMPRATDHVGGMVAHIERLIEKGHAYEADGHVLFSVESFPEYGALSGRSVDDMIAGARVEVAPYKKSPMDFVLWKPSTPVQPGWESPWGRGRPGWHIECSAMSHAILGDTFDLHGGGNDLTFPHHENEIAQSKAAYPGCGFARHWMHNEMLLVDGKKMSKSLGNFFTVRDLLDRGVPGEVIRLVFLGTHYRKPMDWTEAKRSEAEGTLRKWYGMVDGIGPAPTPDPRVVEALADDLNTPGAVTMLHTLARDGDRAGLRASLGFLGLLGEDVPSWAADQAVDLSAHAARLEAAWEAAKASKDFAEVDRMKAGFLAAGVEVRMGRDGVELVAGPDFDASALEMVTQI
ncbi:MAG: cysteine--tRNA ligase [Pseudomonadota bacterium]